MIRDAALFRVLRIWLPGLWLRRRLGGLGKGTRIESPVRLVAPSSIHVGEKAEVRYGCGLYARGREPREIVIGDECRIKEYCILDTYEGHIWLGRRVLLGMGSTIHGHGGVEIGDHTLIGPRAVVLSNEHVFSGVPQVIQDQGEQLRSTVLEQNVWLGAGVIVLGGVRIGQHSVIGAGAVVRQDIPEFSLAVGVPARVVRTLEANSLR